LQCNPVQFKATTAELIYSFIVSFSYNLNYLFFPNNRRNFDVTLLCIPVKMFTFFLLFLINELFITEMSQPTFIFMIIKNFIKITRR